LNTAGGKKDKEENKFCEKLNSLSMECLLFIEVYKQFKKPTYKSNLDKTLSDIILLHNKYIQSKKRECYDLSVIHYEIQTNDPLFVKFQTRSIVHDMTNLAVQCRKRPGMLEILVHYEVFLTTLTEVVAKLDENFDVSDL